MGLVFEEPVTTWLANTCVLSSIGGQTPLEKESIQVSYHPSSHSSKFEIVIDNLDPTKLFDILGKLGPFLNNFHSIVRN